VEAEQGDESIGEADEEDLAGMLSLGGSDVDMVDDIPDFERLSMGIELEQGDDRPVVRPEQLASIFDVGTGMALPPVRDMFRSVVDLCARKPRPLLVNAMEI
jgi:NET1-associated nuclear protein 1 (U3 small nucleolar RNA-associated protein 17)